MWKCIFALYFVLKCGLCLFFLFWTSNSKNEVPSFDMINEKYFDIEKLYTFSSYIVPCENTDAYTWHLKLPFILHCSE